jgi:hypothetical protein
MMLWAARRFRRRRSRHAFTIVVYDRGMSVCVKVQTVHPGKLAVVRRELAPDAVGSAWRPPQDIHVASAGGEEGHREIRAMLNW